MNLSREKTEMAPPRADENFRVGSPIPSAPLRIAEFLNPSIPPHTKFTIFLLF